MSAAEELAATQPPPQPSAAVRSQAAVGHTAPAPTPPAPTPPAPTPPCPRLRRSVAPRPGAASHAWLWWLVVSSGVLAAAAVLEFQPPRTIVVPVLDLRLPQMCSAQRIFGIDCPGCGLTRSFVLAAHGELRQAVAVHPVGTLFFMLLALQIPWRLWQGWQAVRRRNVWRSGRIELGVAAVLIAAAFLWWAIPLVGF